jgi:hypothetical protein
VAPVSGFDRISDLPMIITVSTLRELKRDVTDESESDTTPDNVPLVDEEVSTLYSAVR